MGKKLLGPHFSSTVSSLPHKSQKYLHSDIPCQSAYRTHAHVCVCVCVYYFLSITHTTECILPYTTVSIWVDLFFSSSLLDGWQL